ncbi:MAG: cupredoxin domain-containing protein [Thermoleophilia bacterium]|nr:cupredoxin domain-containing protein [Thermoleophilia bacterium]
MILSHLNDPAGPPRILLISLALIISGFVLAACGSDDSDSDPAAESVAVTITDSGCSPTDLKTVSGSTTFAIDNKDSEVNNEFEILDGDSVLAERENLVPGLSSEVTVDLDPGTYDIVCGNPGDREPTGKLVVSGSGG